MRPTSASAIGLVFTLATMASCASPLASLNETLMLWHGGERDAAIARSANEYARFRDDNELREEAIAGWASSLQRRVDEEPIVAKRERPGMLVSERMIQGMSTLDAELRGDLLSHEASRVARAIGSIAGLALTQHASALIALVYEPKVIESDGDILPTLDRAERTVTIKRMALDALKRLK